MNLIEVDKPEVKKTVVIYSGRFQPFHKGHYASYAKLVSKFGADNVYIGTSNDQSGTKSPFSFREKKEIATKMFGIPSSKFLQIRNPYQPVEILKKFDGQTTQYIAAVGEKDATRLQGKYFKPYKGKSGYGYDEIGYVYAVPAEQNPISGTDVRKWLGATDKEKAKKGFLKAYPKFDKEVFKMITGKINENFIKGYPSEEDVKKIHSKNDKFRTTATTDDSYVYDPISELIDRIAAEEIFNDFLAEYLGEAPNKALDQDITYTNVKGQQKKIKARDALRLPKDHPAHIQAKKIAGTDDAPASQPKAKEEPGKAAQAAAKPAQPGQPVKKDQTQQGKSDKASADGEQGPPPEQKLSGAELKSSAETTPKDDKAAKFKQSVDNARKELSKEDNETIDKVNNPKSPERKGMVDNIKSGFQKFGNSIKNWAKHKAEMVGGTMDAVKALASGQKIGSTKNKETGQWEYSDEKRKEHIGHIKHFAKDVALIMGSMALGGAGVAAAKAIGAGAGAAGVGGAALKGAAGVFTHGAGGFAAHLGKDIAKHATLETLGMGATSAAGGGAVLSTISGGLLENINEEVDNNRFLSNAFKKVVEKMGTYQMSDEQLLKSIESYKKNKPKQDAADLLKENLSETKQQSIQHFVEFATKRLKLKETPKISLVGGREFAEVKTSLGGFDPISKEIYVATEGRLTADILRTLAHEMVHRKQDELGLVRNSMKDGADGSPIENQAHAVAGILMREYGRINKQIYNEDISMDVDKGDTVLMGKFKNKKVVVKDIGKDDYGMPTINGKKAATFRLGDKGQNIFKKEIDEVGEGSSKPYSFTQRENQKDNKVYAFTTTSKEDYKVEFDYKDLHDAWEMEFGIYFGSGDKVINKGEIYSVMATVTNIALDFIKKVNPKIIYFRAAKNFNNDNRREKLYLAYIKKQLPNWTLGKHSGLTTLINPKYKNQPTLSEGLLLEGGAYGHMAHPFDDMDLTFVDLQNIITGALNGDLGVVREKTDGQALAISWKNGRLIAARNKSHLANAGVRAMGIEDVASKFGGRGGLTDAYNYAMKDLSAAISSLSEAQRKKIFNEGKCFMNLEVIWPQSVNVIPYGQALLIFHNTTCYDENGVAVGADQGASSTLAGMIKQVNADVQSKYTIQGPPVTEIPKSEDLSSKKGKYLSKLKKLQSEFGLSDGDTVAMYHQSWWENFIDKKSPVKVDKLTKEALVRRWAFGDKSFRLNTISNPKLQEWAMNNDKVNVAKQQKDNIKPFEEIFLGVGADVLDFVGSVLTVHPDKAIRAIKNKFKSVASDVRSGGDKTKIQKLRQELKRLNSLGGIDRVVASEGIVFFYNGKTYKLTGTFAPLNQILGLFY